MAITIPNIFQPLTLTDAVKVNSNFDTLATRALDKTGDTMSGQLNMNGNLVRAAELRNYSETKTAPSITANVLTLDYSLGNVFVVTNNANITTFTVSNWPASGKKGAIELWLLANGSAFTQAWGSVRWPGAVAPTLSTTNNKYDVLTFHTFDGGTTVFGLISGQLL